MARLNDTITTSDNLQDSTFISLTPWSPAHRKIYHQNPNDRIFRPRGANRAHLIRDTSFTCPEGSKECPGPDTPCCLVDQVCDLYTTSGVTAVNCCTAGSTCGGSPATCASDQVSCPTGGACCNAGYSCLGTGCIAITSSSDTSASPITTSAGSITTVSSTSGISPTSTHSSQTPASSMIITSATGSDVTNNSPSASSTSSSTKPQLPSSSASTASTTNRGESPLSLGAEIATILGTIIGFFALIAVIYYGQKEIRARKRR